MKMKKKMMKMTSSKKVRNKMAKCTASQLVKKARSQLGVKEKPKNSNRTKYGKAFGMNGQPWCAMFVWWCFHQLKADALFCGGKRLAYVPSIADYYIAQKRIVKKSRGKKGDLVFFDFDHNGNSDHIGIILKNLGGGYYLTIEGNTGVGNNTNGGQVMKRKRHISVISRIARPKYAKTKSKPTTVSKMYTLKRGSTGKYVKLLQKRLSVKADGIFGVQTEKAVKKWQKKKGLKVDGIVGSKTWKSLL